MDKGKVIVDELNNLPDCAEDVRILVVDNDMKCLATVSGLLKELNYQVVTSTSAFDALSALRSNAKPVDVILTEIHIPIMSGLDFMEVIRREFQLPVILMSENDDWRFIVNSISKGAMFYFVKPEGLSGLKSIWKLVYSWKKCRLACMHQNLAKARPRKRSAVTGYAGASKRLKLLCTTPWVHRLFLNCIEDIGPENVTPEEILELMDIECFTTDDIAANLQVYRACLEHPDPTNQQFNQDIGTTSANPVLQVSSDDDYGNPRGHHVFPSPGGNDVTQAQSGEPFVIPGSEGIQHDTDDLGDDSKGSGPGSGGEDDDVADTKGPADDLGSTNKAEQGGGD